MYVKLKVKVGENQEDGSVKTVGQEILVDALSFTEAEARATEKLTEMHPSFEIVSMSFAPFHEVMLKTTGQYWISILLKFPILNEKTGKIKYDKSRILLQGDTVKHAHENLLDSMRGVTSDFIVDKIEVTDRKSVV